jgi:hypothetical protein
LVVVLDCLFFLVVFCLKPPQSEASPLGPTHGGFVYQDFEGPDQPGWSDPPTTTVRLSLAGEPIHSGNYSWRIDSTAYWNYVYVQNKEGTWHTDLIEENNDRLTFWIYVLPGETVSGTDVTVAVKFYDHGIYNTNGVEVWTTATAHYSQWTKLSVLFDQLPQDLNLHDIDKLEFKNYRPGTYYLDDIQAVREDRIYQSFEPVKRSLPITKVEEFGWVWNGMTNTLTNTGRLSENGEPVHAGEHSWRIDLYDYWAGTGIKSEQEYLSPTTIMTQDFWHVNLDPAHNDRLSFWVYAVPTNGLGNNVNVQFYDRLTHTLTVNGQLTLTDKVEYWTNKAAVPNQWTRLTVPFSELLKITPTLMLTDIDKIQIQLYWPGAYYLDDIKATSSVPQWDKSSLKNGVLKWRSSYPLNQYLLQENTVSGVFSDTHWVPVYTGAYTTYSIPRISQVWYRVRAEEVQDTNHQVPFASDWSEVLEYHAPLVVIDKSRLDQASKLEWTQLPHASSYAVQSASNPAGPWIPRYTGPYPTTPLTATVNTWYRVRALAGTETSDWSPPQWRPDPSEQDLLRTYGTTIRKRNGDVVTLRGVNLGDYLLVEPWMNSWPITDDDTIRQIITDRFGITETYSLFEDYRNAFLTEADFDILKRMGVNLIRLPLYYLDLQDENGHLIANGFERIDWVVDAYADRGMYVLLDLHGAPGAQSREFHTGRKDRNMLFSDTITGTEYQSRTVELWQAIAAHYKGNSTVMGYDLLNEPIGVISGTYVLSDTWSPPTESEKQKLWNFYDRLYTAIRTVDPNHIIVLEGIWDWDTLPSPADWNWKNVAYQFHYYYFCETERGGTGCTPDISYADYVQAYTTFITRKITMAHDYQYFQCQVPAMVGEFNAFDSWETWDYYLSNFNAQNWSWAMWSYKATWPNSRWGLLTDLDHAASDIPDFGTESTATLHTKLSIPFETLRRYGPNTSLVDLVKHYATEPYAPSKTANVIVTANPQSWVSYGDELTYTLVISAAPGTQVALYDLLEDTTFVRFVTQPMGVSHENNFITGTLTITPTPQLAVSFVVQVGTPSTVIWPTVVTNHACLYIWGGAGNGCVCSNEVTNSVFQRYRVYLPVLLRQ